MKTSLELQGDRRSAVDHVLVNLEGRVTSLRAGKDVCCRPTMSVRRHGPLSAATEAAVASAGW
jgi:hypothetical protein